MPAFSGFSSSDDDSYDFGISPLLVRDNQGLGLQGTFTSGGSSPSGSSRHQDSLHSHVKSGGGGNAKVGIRIQQKSGGFGSVTPTGQSPVEKRVTRNWDEKDWNITTAPKRSSIRPEVTEEIPIPSQEDQTSRSKRSTRNSRSSKSQRPSQRPNQSSRKVSKNASNLLATNDEGEEPAEKSVLFSLKGMVTIGTFFGAGILGNIVSKEIFERNILVKNQDIVGTSSSYSTTSSTGPSRTGPSCTGPSTAASAVEVSTLELGNKCSMTTSTCKSKPTTTSFIQRKAEIQEAPTVKPVHSQTPHSQDPHPHTLEKDFHGPHADYHYETFSGKITMTVFSLLSDVVCLFVFFVCILLGFYPEYKLSTLVPGLMGLRKKKAPNDPSGMGLGGGIGRSNGFFFSPDDLNKRPGWNNNLWWFLLTGFTNMICSFFNYKGIEHIHASTYQVFRGSRVIFVGLFSKLIMKKVMSSSKFLGLWVCFFGVCLVSLVTVEDPSYKHAEAINGGQGKHHSPLLGMFFCGLSAGLGSLHMQLQEYVYRKARNTPPLLAVGIEGISGIVFGLLMCIPTLIGMDQDSLERERRSFHLLCHSGELQFLFVLLMLLFGLSACAGSQLGNDIAATGRAVLECTKTLFVWAFEVVRVLIPVLAVSIGSLLVGSIDPNTQSLNPGDAGYNMDLDYSLYNLITWRMPVKLNPFFFYFWVEKMGIAALFLGTFLYFEVIDVDETKAWLMQKRLEAKREFWMFVFPSMDKNKKGATNIAVPGLQSSTTRVSGGNLNRISASAIGNKDGDPFASSFTGKGSKKSLKLDSIYEVDEGSETNQGFFGGFGASGSGVPRKDLSLTSMMNFNGQAGGNPHIERDYLQEYDEGSDEEGDFVRFPLLK